jgi:hypothetical protein
MVWTDAGDSQVKEERRVIPVSVVVTEEVVCVVVVETLGLLVVELFGKAGVEEIVVVWIRSVVNGETGSPVGLPVGQSVVGSNVGHDVVSGVVLHGGQDAHVGLVVNCVVHGGAVSIDVVDVGQGAHVDVVVVVVAATGCGSSMARTTVSNRFGSSVCIAF